jgi:hypothetical protein
VFGSDPTLGYCEGVLTWLIRDGHYGATPLGGRGAIIPHLTSVPERGRIVLSIMGMDSNGPQARS